MIHIYCGDGKGKTTAAAGLAVRAKGAGIDTAFFQFLKDGSSSEVAQLEKLGITVTTSRCVKFTFEMTPEEKRQMTEVQDAMLCRALELVKQGCGLIVLDEFFGAVTTGTLSNDAAEKFVEDFPASAELVLTGRDPGEFFLGKADYISEIKAVRHPYSSGLPARKGIEY